MYIDKLEYKNVGPISEMVLNTRKSKNRTPVPLVLVGKNGSGKSIFLSNIVDSFYEIADKVYDNATENSEGGHQYYKEISPEQIQIGKNYMVSHICMSQGDSRIEYVFKSGEYEFEEFRKVSEIDINLNWNSEVNYKNVVGDNKKINDAFEKNIVCFFGPERYAKPSWMGKLYYPKEEMDTYSVRPRYARKLNNPITAMNLPEMTLQWLFDVIADSRADLERNKTNGYTIVFPSTNDINLLSISRKNAEEVMSAILGEKIVFRMGNRSEGKHRLSILRENDRTLLVPSLGALSTGQMALFNMFSTIIRYADTDDINLSHKLNDIEGIVIIDEIELHLHSKLQREVLPELIALFPRIQFIITSHSPLFLLGMKEKFTDDGFDIIEMPSGKKVSTEEFSEFENAYHYYTETEKFQETLKKMIDAKHEKPLIITEGSTDWKHMKAAYNELVHDSRCKEWLSELDFEFLEYEPENGKTEGDIKLKMGGSQLKTMCEQYSMLRQPQKMIFIADCDVPDVKKSLQSGDEYKNWSNNVYSLCLPIPKIRQKTPDICIEHLYSDEEITRECHCDDGESRRLFIGNEFDDAGFSVGEEKYFCENRNSCGPGKINIIDGSDKKKVIKPWDGGVKKNYALSKMEFAKRILNKEKPFDNMDFSNFIPLFEIIKKILNEPYAEVDKK